MDVKNSSFIPSFWIVFLIYLIISLIVLFIIKKPWKYLVLALLSLIVSIYPISSKDTSDLQLNQFSSGLFYIPSIIFLYIYYKETKTKPKKNK